MKKKFYFRTCNKNVSSLQKSKTLKLKFQKFHKPSLIIVDIIKCVLSTSFSQLII